MRTLSWILLAVLGAGTLVVSLISANLAYSGADYPIGGIAVAEVAGDRGGLETALRGVRGTAAAYAAAFGTLFLVVTVGPYRRGERWAWWALLAGVVVLAAVTAIRVPALGIRSGVGAALVQGVIAVVALLLDVKRLRKASSAPHAT